MEQIDQLIQTQPDIIIREIRENLQLRVSYETARKAVLNSRYVYKKKSLLALEQERPPISGPK